MDDDKISISFSGWTTVPATDVNFTNSETGRQITGAEWAELTEDEQENYVLESLATVLAETEPVYEEIECVAGDIG